MSLSAFGIEHGVISKAFRFPGAAKKVRLAEHQAALGRAKSENPFGGPSKPKRPGFPSINTRAPVPGRSTSQAIAGRNILTGQRTATPLGRGANRAYQPGRPSYR